MVELQAVTVSFRPRFVLRDLSLSVAEGECLALWGHNGAGKSTALHAILGLVPYTGRILVGGLDARSGGAAARRLVGWVPQEFPAVPETVEQTFRFVAGLRETAPGPAIAHLEPFGLGDAGPIPVAALSGGQRRRLAFALALLGDPPVLLLDEPTANLDPAGRAIVLQMLQELRQRGKTLLIASHRLGDFRRLADRIAVLRDGCLVRVAPALQPVRRSVGVPPRMAEKGRGLCEDV